MLGSCAINKVILMGRLTRDPEIRQSQNGTMVCRFSIAIDRPLSTAAAQGGAERQADFLNIVAFNKTAEFVSKYFTKGRLVLVEGSLRTGSYNDTRYPDVKHFTTEIYADNVSFGETKSSSGSGSGYAPQQFAQPQQSAQAFSQPQQNASISVGTMSDFAETVGDGDLPF